MKQFFLIAVLLIFILPGFVGASENGTITLDFTSNLTIQGTTRFQPLFIQIAEVKPNKETIIWESLIESPNDINISVVPGEYKLYYKAQGHRTIWELDNEGVNYNVSSSDNLILPLYANEPGLKEVFADGPWRTVNNQIPIFLLVKDTDNLQCCGLDDYDLGNVEIYQDTNCDWDNDEGSDSLLTTETRWSGTTINATQNGNLYFPGDWYGITYLDASLYGISGNACFHVVIRDIGGITDLDGDTHSHFNVSVGVGDLPSLEDWYAGDVHYHSYYTDNNVEVGAPIEATVEAGKSIGLDWVTITDHSFDLDSYMWDTEYNRLFDEEGKWDDFGNDCKDVSQGGHSDSEFKCIRAEEISVQNANGKFVHLLGYNISVNIDGEGADGLGWYYPKEFNLDLVGSDGLDDTSITFNLPQVITWINAQGGFAYASHPAYQPPSLPPLNRDIWQTADYNLIFDGDPNNDYSGLEVWNSIGNETYRDAGITKWKELLRNGETVYISGGSDAHGDFSHGSKLDWTGVERTDNNFGKVRTAV